MDRGALIIVGVGLGAYLLWRRMGSVNFLDPGIYDARDAWAQGTGAMPVDTSILDVNDALAQGSGTVPFIDLGPWGGDAPDLSADPATGVQYDAMGNAISNVAYWGDSLRWDPSKIPAQYLQPIRNAESRYGLPYNLLARQLWQESRYNANAVNRWSGAQGIAQFMPATAEDLGIDPFNALQAIDAAGRYMKQLRDQTGSWLLALAAYNWGIGNVLRKGIAQAPTETRNYYSQILADIGMSSASA